jgi:hypothetical protein
MSRRQFLDLGKKAVAAGMAPKGVLGKVLQGAVNLAPTVGKIFNLKNEILLFLKAEFLFKWTGEYYSVTTEAEAMRAINSLRKNYDNIYSALMSTVPSPGITFEYKRIKEYLDDTEDILKTGGANLSHPYEFHDSKLVMASTWLSHFHGDVMAPEMMEALWSSGLITPQMEADFKKNYGIDKRSYLGGDEEYYREMDRKWEKEQMDKISKDIKYSRMDTAGGSEDEGYAKYFENYLKENYADGKKPGRKGLAKRSGVNCKQSVSKLRKVAKNSTGERRRMAHWCANMKSGKKKK